MTRFNKRKRELSRQQPGYIKKSWELPGFREKVKLAREKDELDRIAKQKELQEQLNRPYYPPK